MFKRHELRCHMFVINIDDCKGKPDLGWSTLVAWASHAIHILMLNILYPMACLNDNDTNGIVFQNILIPPKHYYMLIILYPSYLVINIIIMLNIFWKYCMHATMGKHKILTTFYTWQYFIILYSLQNIYLYQFGMSHTCNISLIK